MDGRNSGPVFESNGHKLIERVVVLCRHHDNHDNHVNHDNHDNIENKKTLVISVPFNEITMHMGVNTDRRRTCVTTVGLQRLTKISHPSFEVGHIMFKHIW